MSSPQSSAYTRALGARLLAEANDLKRTPESMAQELKQPLSHIQGAIDGILPEHEYRPLFESISKMYPIAFGRLWIEPSDTRGGMLHMSVEQSKASARIFDRKDRHGKLTPYYEYRDTATSRHAPFRPEWIRELRDVTDADPNNPDVAYNKGHFLHQTTLFVGPVNFYWEVNGKRHCAEMNTGDSNYITPFWPHSFANRDPSKVALIMAVTYGGEVARAREELARLGPDVLTKLKIEIREKAVAHAALLSRHLDHEGMNKNRFADLCAEKGIPLSRALAIVNAKEAPTPADIATMASILTLSPRDLMPPSVHEQEEVVVAHRRDALKYMYPDEANPCYEFTRLARASHQPYLKSFLLKVLPQRKPAELLMGLHQFIYNYGEEAVVLQTRAQGEERVTKLAPGDSAYVTPMTSCRFEVEGKNPAEIYMVRIQGDMHADAIFELSSMAPQGLARVAKETTRWF